MMKGITGLTESKRAVLAVLLILCAAVALFIGKIHWVEFREFTTWIFIPYAAAETVSHAVRTIKSKGEGNGSKK
jgi:hypothetical protein